MRRFLTLCTFFLLVFNSVSAQQQQSIPLQFDVSGYSQDQNEAHRFDASSMDTIPSIKAEMNVNEAGALTYLLPIEVLKGVNSFQPNLALAYNSQSGNGTAGWGWNIMGLSMITQGGKSKLIDGVTIGVQYDGQDPFYLDGERLLKVSATTYVTEKYSKIKITKQSAGSEFGFIIQYTDGRIAKYKELVPGQYYIATLIDALDNEVHYAYNITSNVPVLTTISYGGNSAANDKFFVEFIYNDRTTITKSYRNGTGYFSSKILSEIRVKSTYLTANNGLYRKYKLFFDRIQSYTTERLIKITVENENGAALKPLKFNYNSATTGVIESSSSYINNWPFQTIGLGSVVVGDFYGTGVPSPIYETKESETNFKLYNPKTGTISSYSKSKDYFSGKVLRDNKISEADDLIALQTDYPGGTTNPSTLVDKLTFKTTSLSTGQAKTILMDLKGGLNEINGTRDDRPRNFVSGDFNNDGLVDLLIFERLNLNRIQKVYFAEIGLLPGGTAVPATVACPALGIDDKTDFYIIEFDGDGVPEIMVVNRTTNKYTILKFNSVTNTLTAIAGQTNIALTNFTEKTPIIFGDFNGDGLTDFITPQKIYNLEGSTAARELSEMETETLLWWQYISTGQSFVKTQKDFTQQKLAYIATSQRNVMKKSSTWDKIWSGKPDTYQYTEYATSTILAADFNNDGKTDLITVRKFGKAKYDLSGKLSLTNIQPLNSFENVNPVNANRIFFHETRNLPDGSQTLHNLSTTIALDNVNISPLSLILNYSDYNYLNTYKTGLLIHDPILRNDKKFIINNDNFIEGQLREVDNGSPVRQRIEYRAMAEKQSTYEDAAYSTESTQLNYPYYVHKNIGTNYLAYKVHTLFDDKIITKEYRYRNGIQHLGGKGFLGFQKTFVSDPYESIFENGKYRMKDIFKGHFWKTNTYDPLMEGALLSTAYGSLNMNSIFSLSTANSSRFDKGGNRYLILTTSETNKDFLKNITIFKSYEYDTAGDLLLKKINTSYNSIGSSVEEYTYEPESSSGQHYHFGRITTTTNTTWKGSDSFSTKEEQFFNANGTVYQTKKYGNATLPIVTDFTYYPFGGTKSQTVSANGIAPVTTTYEYDVTNRYIRKTTDAEGMISTANVNALGKTLSEVSPLGHTTSYRYDDWGNIKETTDYLGKKTTFAKNITPNEPLGYYSISVKKEGGAEIISIKDIFDRTIKTKSETANGLWAITETEYDLFGKKIKESEPYFDGDPILWNTIEYDAIDRAVKHTSFTGKVMTTCYEGLKVTVEDGHKKMIKVADAMGHIIKHQDGGGEIFYKYYPNGALKEANYDGVITKIEIDGWGNKTKLIDPSAGTYRYEYDNFSRIKKEINPKGGYTEYTYDDFGKIISENTSSPSENTVIAKNYSYDSTTKLPTVVSGTYNGKSYTYTTFYNDPYHRITGKKEQTPDFTYLTTLTYGDYGRVDMTEFKTTISNPNYTTTSQVSNKYDSRGILISQTDAETSAVIWELGTTNAQGAITNMSFGNGYGMSVTYNSNNLSLEKIRHNRRNGTLVNIDYNYDVQKGILLSRNNLVFGKNETYTYDDLDRLLSESVNGSVVQQYSYDKRGRMTSNSEVGSYNYNTQDYKLQSVDFNVNGSNLNTNRGFAEIQYNAFKNPNEILLEGKDRISYDYSILKTRSASYYGSMDATAAARPNRKFYSSDKSIEIVKENGTVKIITYITGDAYTANYMKVDQLFADGQVSSGKYFLHRDNQNTILAISGGYGNVIERRYFDAWGNLKEAKLGSSDTSVLPNALGWISGLLIDRGYTGHEHLKTVGLIHMNGRLYDPALRRFLSPDNYVQDVYNTQNFNRYGYTLNNPLLYTDPSGEFIVEVLIGVAVAVVLNGINNSINKIPFWYGSGKAGVVGGVSAAISLGIGEVMKGAFSSAFSTAVVQAGLHGFTGGLLSMANGGDFLSGFAAGAVSSLISSGLQYLGNVDGFYLDDDYTKWTSTATRNPNLFKGSMIAAGGLSGGLSSTIAGGKFVDGFRQGVITSGLNHVAHMIVNKIQEYKTINELLENAGYDPNATALLDNAGAKDFASKVFPDMYSQANSPDFEFVQGLASKSGQTADGQAGIRVTATDGVYTAKFTGLIKLNTHTKNSYHYLAATMGHELSHAIDAVSGNYTKWYNEYKNGKVARAISEDRAYQWELNHGSLIYNSQDHQNWKNLMPR